jgi:hypothetical protein
MRQSQRHSTRNANLSIPMKIYLIKLRKIFIAAYTVHHIENNSSSQEGLLQAQASLEILSEGTKLVP